MPNCQALIDEWITPEQLASALSKAVGTAVPEPIRLSAAGASVIVEETSMPWRTEIDLTGFIQDPGDINGVEMAALAVLRCAQDAVIEARGAGWPSVSGTTGESLALPYAKLVGRLLAIGFAREEVKIPLPTVNLA